MRFLIKGELDNTAFCSDQPREENVRTLRSAIIPLVQSLMAHQLDGKILGGGVIPLRTFVMIAELPDTSLTAARRFLMSLPGFELFDWEITPLESFEELKDFVDPG